MNQNYSETVNITINGQKCAVAAGSTVLDAAKACGIHIPTLCYTKELNPRANCRMCIVQIDDNPTLKLSCATKVWDGMVVVTNSPAIEQERKTALELILANHPVDCHHCLRVGNSKCDDLDPKFCEMCFFCDCVRDGFCELQDLAREYKIDVLPYEQRGYDLAVDGSTGSLIRNPNKCVKCRRCQIVCKDIQTVNCLQRVTVGNETLFAPEGNKPLAESNCVLCGRCVQVCPTGALFMLEHKDELLYHTHKPGLTTVAQISASVLKELAKLFKLDTPEADIRLVAAGLRKIGVDYVVSDDFALAMVQDQAAKAIEAKLVGGATVVITNSPAAVKFVNSNFAELADGLVVYDSAQHAFGRYVKTSFAAAKQLDAAKLRTISITNDNENAAEALASGSVDFVVNARELYRIFLRTGVNLKKRRPSELDSFDGSASAQCAGLLAPATWQMEGEAGEQTLKLGGEEVKAAVAYNLGQSRKLLDDLKAGSSAYRVIRINA